MLGWKSLQPNNESGYFDYVQLGSEYEWNVMDYEYYLF